jgi:predicted flap endonuclease-1-like 5' DNA nuclease
MEESEGKCKQRVAELESILEKRNSLASVIASDKKFGELAEQSPEPQAGVPDNLEVIKGIGPVISKILNKAGIFTFAQLSATNADRLRVILSSMIERFVDEDSLLEQARQLAREKKGKGSEEK